MKRLTFSTLLTFTLLLAPFQQAPGQELKLNDLEYFETQGVNVLVYSNLFTGGFNDEKTAGIELIHHGVRTAQGGAVRLSNTPEQWDLVPAIPTRTVNRESNSIESVLRYEDYDFDSRVVVTAKGKGVEITVYLDKPVPAELEGAAGFNLEFLPSQYWGKTYLADGRLNRFPMQGRYVHVDQGHLIIPGKQSRYSEKTQRRHGSLFFYKLECVFETPIRNGYLGVNHKYVFLHTE